jgi:hypothetical protein
MKVEQVVRWNVSRENVLISALEIGCIEPRLWVETQSFFAMHRGCGRAVPINWAGGAKDLAGPEPGPTMRQLILSYEKHGTRVFKPSLHEDCTAYGLDMPQPSKEALEFMIDQLAIVHQRVTHEFRNRPEVPRLELFAVTFDGVHKITF